MTLLACRALFVVLSSPPAVLDFCGGCAVPCLLSLALGWVHFWPAVSTAPVPCKVCSLGCPSWLVLLFMSLLSFTCSCGGVVWSQDCGPSCCSCVLGVCCAVMSPWAMVAPSPSVVSCLGFFLWHLFGLGLVGCGPAWVPAFFFFGGGGGGLSFPCPGCFRLVVPTVWLSRLLEFS